MVVKSQEEEMEQMRDATCNKYSNNNTQIQNPNQSTIRSNIITNSLADLDRD
jgi:hypothetical protein